MYVHAHTYIHTRTVLWLQRKSPSCPALSCHVHCSSFSSHQGAGVHRPIGDAGLLHKPSPRDQVGLGQAEDMVANSVPQEKGAERPLLLEAQPVCCKVSRWRMAGGTFPGTLFMSPRSEHLRKCCGPGLSLPCCSWGEEERGALPHPCFPGPGLADGSRAVTLSGRGPPRGTSDIREGFFCWWQNLGHYRQLAVGGWARMGLFLCWDLAKAYTWRMLS